MTRFLGLTGSIGMGKSTTAQMFRDLGIAVHDSDAVVHELYQGKAVPLIEAEFPGTVVDGIVDRHRLSQRVVGNETAMKRLEAIVHPLVRQAEFEFRKTVADRGDQLAILDIPLLFETGRADQMDGVIVVTAAADEQRKRVLKRPDMSVEKFEAILARQTPDKLKREEADYVIDTSYGLEHARQQVMQIIKVATTNADPAR